VRGNRGGLGQPSIQGQRSSKFHEETPRANGRNNWAENLVLVTAAKQKHREEKMKKKQAEDSFLKDCPIDVHYPTLVRRALFS
jgi:hypothetical protein